MNPQKPADMFQEKDKSPEEKAKKKRKKDVPCLEPVNETTRPSDVGLRLGESLTGLT
jgi:hypothetical protein